MSLAELLESKLPQFNGRVFMEEGSLGIYLYSTEHSEEKPLICLFAKTNGGWIGTYSDENTVAEWEHSRSEINRILLTFAEIHNLTLIN